MSTDVVLANIEVHTRLAATYDLQEPHYRPENQVKVRRNLEGLAQRCGGGKLLDLGCGTGFIIRLARDLFSEVHGVDITPAMLERVDTSSGNVYLHKSVAETLPFADEEFGMVSAYSFLHHVKDYRVVLKQSHRVLQPGGIVYIDLEPNKLFWDTMTALADVPSDQLRSYVQVARDSVTSTDAKVEQEFGIRQETFRLAEYTKAVLGGFDPRTVGQEIKALGFRSCDVQLEWYVGQAQVMHGQSFEEAEKIESYLRAISPLSDHLFKYVRLILVK